MAKPHITTTIDPETLPLDQYRAYLRKQLGYDPLRSEAKRSTIESSVRKLNEFLRERGIKDFDPYSVFPRISDPTDAEIAARRARNDDANKTERLAQLHAAEAEIDPEILKARRRQKRTELKEKIAALTIRPRGRRASAVRAR